MKRDAWLYLAYRCFENQPDKIRKKGYGRRDGPVWEGDSVEFFLGDGLTYFHYAVNAAGSPAGISIQKPIVS